MGTNPHLFDNDWLTMHSSQVGWSYLDGIPALLPHDGLTILLDGLSYLCRNRPSDPLSWLSSFLVDPSTLEPTDIEGPAEHTTAYLVRCGVYDNLLRAFRGDASSVLYTSIVSLQHGPYKISAMSHSRPSPVSFDGACTIPEARVPEDIKKTVQMGLPDRQEKDDDEWLRVRDKFTVPISLQVELQPRYRVEVSKKVQEDFFVEVDCPALKRHLGEERDSSVLSEPQIAHLVQGMYSVSSLSRRWKMLQASPDAIRDDLSRIYSGDVSSWLAVHHVVAMESDHECIDGDWCTWFDLSDVSNGISGRGRRLTCGKEAYLRLHVLYMLNWGLFYYPLYKSEGRLYGHDNNFDLHMSRRVSASVWDEWNRPVIVEEHETPSGYRHRLIGRSRATLTSKHEGWIIQDPEWSEWTLTGNMFKRRLIGCGGIWHHDKGYGLINSVNDRLMDLRLGVQERIISDYLSCASSILPKDTWRSVQHKKEKGVSSSSHLSLLKWNSLSDTGWPTTSNGIAVVTITHVDARLKRRRGRSGPMIEDAMESIL